MSNSNLSLADIVTESGTAPDTFSNRDQDTSDTTTSGSGEQDKLVAYVNGFYTRKRMERRPYEAQWYINAAMIRGLHATKWNPLLNTLESRKASPAHRSKDFINHILPKVKAKLSKFLKNRTIPVVSAATTEHEDILNAEGTTKALEYQWDRLRLEELYEDSLLWSMQTGKAFWWFRWDKGAVAQVRDPGGLTVKPSTLDVPLGDVHVDLGSAFELLVDDLGVMRIQKQREIQRITVIAAADAELQYDLPPGMIKPEIRDNELFQYQRQIATLGSHQSSGLGMSSDNPKSEATHVVRKEHFIAPSAKHPNGRYIVVAGDQLLHLAEELPYDMARTGSPFPVVEFADTVTAGQFWPTTMVEQLIPIQRQYNRIRNKLDEQMKLQLHPKTFIPTQANINLNNLTSEVGQNIPYVMQPGMPPPSQWYVAPPNISGDLWRTLDTLRTERDEVSTLYPAAMGASGATSGFDTNLLQEAADSVHAPDIRRNEQALREAALKVRRIMRMGYDIPRLISILGKDRIPEAFEFSQDMIDEHANIIIDTGSALPSQKHARIEALMKMDERQLFGPPGDPGRNRKLMRMLEMGSSAETADLVGKDEDHARLENLSFTKGEPVEDPMPWENHDVEYEIHTDLLKSSQIKQWPPEQRQALVRHVILHVKWKNPTNALQLAAVFGMQDVVAEIQQTMMIQQQFASPPPVAGTPPEGQAQPAAQQAPPAA